MIIEYDYPFKNPPFKLDYYFISDRDILNFERFIGLALPKEYKEFLKTAGGKSPYPDCFPLHDFPDGSPCMDCQRFYGLFPYPRPFENVLSYQKDSNNNYWHGIMPDDLYTVREAYLGRMPADLQPIGYCSTDDQICLMLEGNHAGSIWFWDHEDERDSSSYDNCYFLAESLTEFINSFETDEYFESNDQE